MPLLLTTAYLAPVHYYARLYHASKAQVESCCHYLKQTYRNRCTIAAANGATDLSIPIVRPSSGRCLTRDIRISDHDNWRHLHWQALVSAYGSSPFFEFYADSIRPFYERRYDFLFDFNEGLRQTIQSELHLTTSVSRTEQYVAEPAVGVTDLREVIHPKRDCRVGDPAFTPVSYYQVFQLKLGFLPNLSIVDLLFNMGPEALLVLRDSVSVTNKTT